MKVHDCILQIFFTDIHILVVGITQMVNQYEINEIATDPDDLNVFFAADFTALGDVQQGLKRAMCNGKQTKLHNVNLKVNKKLKKLLVHCCFTSCVVSTNIIYQCCTYVSDSAF